MQHIRQRSDVQPMSTPVFDVDYLKDCLCCDSLDVIQLYKRIKETLSCLVHIHEVGQAVHDITQHTPLEYSSTTLMRSICEQIALNGLNDKADTRYGKYVAYLELRYDHLLEICRNLTNIQYQRTQWNADEAYPALTSDDRSLAALWLPESIAEKDQHHEEARVLSARAAEKVVSTFYQLLGHKVVDTAISQLDANGSYDWRTHDLLLTDENPRAVDVKNARWQKDNRSHFVDWCVPKFKQDRANADVTIVGVLSPYLWLDSINNPDHITANYRPCNITVLGETCLSAINELAYKFNTDIMQVRLDDLTVIPSWIFDYSTRFYRERDARIQDLKEYLANEGIPPLPVFALFNINPLPLLLLGQVDLPHDWKQELSAWQIGAFESLCQSLNGVVTLPVIYLAIIRHFLEAVTSTKFAGLPWQGYDSLLYLYNDPFVTPWFLQDQNRLPILKPLWVTDPLDVIPDLEMMLGNLWEHRNDPGIDLADFETFTFYGRGLLRGRKRNTRNWISIWAYCGSCGKRPLILGQNEACTECGFLVCDADRCGFCRDNCEEGDKRRAA